MLVEFTVQNSLSIFEKQTFTMVADSTKEWRDRNTFDPGIGSTFPNLVKMAAIYGPNASGKTNLLKSIGAMQKVVLNSAGFQKGDHIPVKPFLFTKESAETPSEFETVFIEGGTKFQYGFTATKEKIYEEWLFATPPRPKKTQAWFSRKLNEDGTGYEYTFGPNFEKKSIVRESWKSQTIENSLFLSRAIQLGSDQLLPVFNWFKNKLIVIDDTQTYGSEATFENIKRDEHNIHPVLKLLNTADNSIHGMNVEEREASALDKKNLPHLVHSFFENLTDKPIMIREVTLHHPMEKPNDEKAHLSLREESKGTQRLFSLAAPIFAAIEQGATLLIDEFNISIHPMLVQQLIGAFHSAPAKDGVPQLVITTHDTSILDNSLFRRDQIWFTEKDEKNSTRLYSLSEYKPRKGEALAKGYLQGRYGAIPYLGEFRF